MLLGLSAKLAKATIRFVMSVSPHGTLNLTFESFSKNCPKNSSFNNIGQESRGTLHEDQFTILITSRSILLRMKNISEKLCRESQNTHFVLFCFVLFFFFLSKIVPSMR